MDDNTLAVVVSFGALTVSVLGPFFTGVITLRRAEKEREAQRRQAEIDRLQALLQQLIDFSGQHVTGGDESRMWLHTRSVSCSFGIPEINQHIADNPSIKTDTLRQFVVEKVGLHIAKLMED